MTWFTGILLVGACLSMIACVVVAQRRFFKRLLDAYLGLTHWQRTMAGIVVCLCTVYAQKPNTNQVEVTDGEGTNEEGGVVLCAPRPRTLDTTLCGSCNSPIATSPVVSE